MPRLVIVLPLTPLHTGESFAVHDWPLHITVLAPFTTDAARRDIVDAIASAVSRQTAITAVAGADALFGRHHDVPVTLIEDNDALIRVHRALIDTVRPLATSPDEPAFAGPDFRPHVTKKHHGRVHAGDKLTLTQVALVDMAPRSAPGGRSVLATFPLPPSAQPPS
jgi:2'-5' RNA ligase